jgi:hypothetical protein
MNHDIAFTRHALLTSSALDILSAQSLTALLWRPKFLHPDAMLAHTPFLFWLTETLRPRVIVDLETGCGVGYFAFCQAIEKLALEARSIGVDEWPATIPPDIATYNAAQYAEFGTLMCRDQGKALAGFADGSIDILRLHQPQDALNIDDMLERWLPKLSASAVLLVQGARTQGIGPAQQKLQADVPMIRFDHAGGLTAYLIGTAQPERLKKLAALKFGQAGHTTAQAMFRRLGMAVEQAARSDFDEQHIATLQAQATELSAALRTAQTQLTLAEPRHLNAMAMMNRALCDSAEQTVRQSEEIAVLQSRLSSPDTGTQIRLQEVETELRQCREARRDLAAQNSQLRADLAARHADLVTTRVQAEAAARHVHDLLNSTCWKVTAPARHIARPLRRLWGQAMGLTTKIGG